MSLPWLRRFAKQVLQASLRRRRVKTILTKPSSQPTLEALEVRLVPTTLTWVAGSGSWDVNTNWSPAFVPTAADTANINSGAITVTISRADTVGALNLTGGTLNASGGSLSLVGTGTSTVVANATLDGPIFVNAGTLQFAGTSSETVNGDLTINSGGTVRADTPTTFDNLTNSAGGTFIANSGGTVQVTGNFTNGGHATDGSQNGTVEVTAGTLQITGPDSNFSFGTLSGGNWVVQNATLDLGAAITSMTFFGDNTSLTVSGSTANVNLSGLQTIFANSSLTLENNYSLTTTGAANIFGDSLTLVFNGNSGCSLSILSGASLTVGGSNDFTIDGSCSLNLQGGSLTQNAASPLQNNGLITGSGTINGAVVNNSFDSTINPGTATAAGVITINGNLTGAGNSSIKVGGTNAATPDFDQLVVNGNADITGSTLNASLLNSFVPVLGDTFQFLTVSGTTTGTYGTVNLPAPTRQLAVSYLSNGVELLGETILVTTNSDSGAGSLRTAITTSNANTLPDLIAFDILPNTQETISLTSALPAITNAVTIDGTTQQGYAGPPPIILDGSGAGAVNGLTVNASDTVLKGLVIGNFASGAGVFIGVSSDGDTLQLDHIGTDITGNIARSNNVGVDVLGSGATISQCTISANTNVNVIVEGGASGNTIQSSVLGPKSGGGSFGLSTGEGVNVDGASDTLIGSPDPVLGNLIDDNAGNGISIRAGSLRTTVQGNDIGLGSGADGNGNDGIFIETNAQHTTIGGTASNSPFSTDHPGNFISGNGGAGIDVSAGATDVVIQANLIGTDGIGSSADPNHQSGIFTAADGTVIGGSTPGQGNVISGNLGDGITLSGGSTATILGNHIGTNAAGTVAIHNGGAGINVNGSSGNTIGSAGVGIFPSQSTISVDNVGDLSPVKEVVADFDGDGRPDIATLFYSPFGYYLSVVLGNGDGTFQGPLDTPLSTNDDLIDLVATSFFNDPSEPDVVIADATTNSLILLPGNGDGTFGTPVTIALPTGFSFPSLLSQPIVAADFNADGNPDLAIAGTINGTPDVVVLLGNGNGTFQPPLINPTTATPSQLVVGDFTDDSIPDLVALETNHMVEVLAGNGDGTFTTGASFAAGSNTVALAAADFNHDGNLDLAIGSYNPSVRILLGDGAGNFGAPRDYAVGSPGDLQDVAVGDFNGDGNTDVAVTNIGAGTVTVLPGAGNGAFLPAVTVVTGGGSSNTLAAGDFNGDGVDDLVAPAMSLDELTVLLGSNQDVVSRNVISGNSGGGILIQRGSTGNLIANNYIGTTGTGLAALPNGSGDGIDINGASNTTIGGAAGTPGQAPGNLISGNNGLGVQINGNDTVVEGNLIGTDATGTVALANVFFGLFLSGGVNNTVGGLGTAARNVISGNSSSGVLVQGASSSLIEGNYIGTDVYGAAQVGNTNWGVELVNSGQNLILGNVISGNGQSGVGLTGAGTINNRVAGNLIGTNAAGTAAVPNSGGGVAVLSGASNNTVGGTTAAASNVISGNSSGGIAFNSSGSGNVVEGNYVGTDITGTTALGNNGDGVDLLLNSSGNTIGGTAAGASNVISGNTGAGLGIDSSDGTVVQGNYIGTDVTGTIALANVGNGINIAISTDNTIGGSAAGAGNLISGNAGYAVQIGNAAPGNLVLGNRIGTNAAGTAALGNGAGIIVGFSNGVTIGGTSAAARNLISGNVGNAITLNVSRGGVIEGNWIGLNAAGTAAVANGQGIITTTLISNVVIGGTAAGAGNVISGNGNYAILSGAPSTSGFTIEGNFIGTDPTGTFAIGGGGITVLVGGTTIGGTTAAARNVISGNGPFGIQLTGATAIGDVVEGNYIGTNAAGTAALGNASAGVYIGSGANNNLIGGATAGAANVIAANLGDGIDISGAGTFSNPVQGNFIGTNAAGATTLGNAGSGIFLSNGAQGNSIGGPVAGEPNTIAYNAQAGVTVVGATTIANLIRVNSIYANHGLGIDLGGTGTVVLNDSLGHSGPENYQNFPVLVAANDPGSTEITGTLHSAGGTSFTLDFYASPAADPSGYGQGQTYLGSATANTDANGVANFDLTGFPAVAPGTIITATATDEGDDTSEFSQDLAVNSPPAVTILVPPLPQVLGVPQAVTGVTTVFNSQVVDPDVGQTESYAWSVTQAGNPSFALPAGTVTTEPTLRFTPPAPADITHPYVVALTVTDSAGGVSSAAPVTLTAGAPIPAVFINGAPASAAIGSTVALTSTVLNPTGATTATYAWSVTRNGVAYAPGTPTGNPTFAFAPSAGGVYGVTLAVTDSAGGHGSNFVSFLVNAAAPVAAIGGAPSRWQEGVPIFLSAAAAAPSLSGPLTYSWAAYKDGASTPLFSQPNDKTGVFNFTPPDEGSYKVTLTETDRKGNQGTAAPVTIAVGDAPPVARITSPPFSAAAGVPVTLHGTGSTPGTTEATTLTWSVFSSGSARVVATGSGPTFTYTPTAGGVDLVTLTATDDDGTRGQASVAISVTQPTVSVTLTLPTNPTEGASQTVTAVVHGAATGATYTSAWTVTGASAPYSASGAGTVLSATSSSFTFTQTAGNYLAPGKYLVTATVTGSDHTSASATSVLTIQNVAPSVTIGGVPASGTLEGTPVSLAANVTDPGGGGDFQRYQWTVTGPDTFSRTGKAAALGFTPNEAGTYNVTLKVTDSSGAATTATASFSINPAPLAPKILNAPGTNFSGSQPVVNLTATVNDPGNDDVLANTITYAWAAYLNGSTTPFQQQSTLSPNFSFTEATAGTYTVKLTVSDDDAGATGTATAVVLSAAPGTTRTLTASDVPGGATQVVAVALGSAKIDASRLSVPVVAAALNQHDTLIGGSGPNVLQGDSGFNLLQGGTGANTLIATANDTLVGGSGGNPNLFAINPGAGEVATAGATGNTLSFATSATPVTVNLAQSGGQSQTIAANSTLALNGAFQSLVGSAGADKLFAANNSTVMGGGGNDALSAVNGSNIQLQAGDGNVLLSALSASDVTLFGGGGSDTLSASGSTDVTLMSGNGGDTLSALNSSDVTLFGGDGNDSLSSSGSTDVSVQGGSGNDSLSLLNGSDVTLFGGDGSDSLSVSGSTNVSVTGGTGFDTLTALNGSDVTLFGGTGNDSLSATGGTGVSVMGGSSNDTLSSTGGSDVTLFGGSGDSTLSVSLGTGVTVIGGTGFDTLSAINSSDVTLFGGSGGGNLSTSGSTNVSVQGSAGNDTLTALNSSDVTLFGGDGTDSLSTSGSTNATAIGGTGNDTLSSAGGSDVTLFGGTGNDTLSATSGTGVLVIGGTLNDSLSALNSSDVTLFGGNGDDTLSVGGSTNVSVIGGTGSDTLSALGSSDVTLFGGDGGSTLSVSISTNVSVQGGGANDTLSAVNSSDVTLFGGDGNDTLSSSGGTDVTVAGGTGNDMLSVTNGSDVTLFGGGGTDVTVAGGDGNDTLSSFGGTDVTLFGGNGNDSLSSSGGTDVLVIGGDGNSTLSAMNGTDVTLFGGDGNDSLTAGNTTGSTGATDVTVIGGTGNDTLSSSGGTDVTLFGGSGTDNLSVSGSTNVSVYGGSGNDTLSSTDGTDVTLFGGDGNDSLSAGNTTGSTGATDVTVVGGTGNDTLSSTDGSDVTLFGGTGNDNLSAGGSTNVSVIGGSGTDSLSSADSTDVTLFGGSGNDTLSVSGGSNVSVYGGSGNDTLSSTDGTDVTLFGGTGNDNLSAGNSTDSTGASNVTVVGGTGNDTLSSNNSSDVTLFGGSGNDTLSSTGGSNVSVIGGSGNDTLSSTGGSDVTLFGGSGTDSLSSTGGSDVSVSGGSGNDTLSSTDGSDVTLFSGTGNDLLTTLRGKDVSVYGGTGDDTLAAAGGQNVLLAGAEGKNTYRVTGPITATLNDLATYGQVQDQDENTTLGVNTIDLSGIAGGITLNLGNASGGAIPFANRVPAPQTVAAGVTLSLVGQFQNVIGTAGNDRIAGNASSNVLSGGGSGNDTLIGGSGPATLVAGAGNESLVAGSGGTVFQFGGGASGSDVIDPPLPLGGTPGNTLDFTNFGGSVGSAATPFDLRSNQPQPLGSGLTLTLDNPGAINGLMGSAHGDTVIGNGAGDRFYVGSGGGTYTGQGNDTYFFSGHPGPVTITENGPTPNNTLNFLGLAGPVNLNLGSAPNGPQALNLGSMALNVSSPAAFNTIVGTPYNDTIVGNGAANETIIGAGGADYLAAGNGAVYVHGNLDQIVYLDFDELPAPGNIIYTQEERDAIQAGLQRDYADFNYVFTQDPAAAAQLSAATGGQFVTLLFNVGPAGGVSDTLDFHNQVLGGLTSVNINPFLGAASAGLMPATDANIIGLTTTIAAHELGHQSGLEHGDSFGPIGTGIYAGVDPTKYFPAYTGPTGATQTPEDIMASPASVGTTLAQAAGLTEVGERDAIKLAFNDSGTVLQQASLPTQAIAVPGLPSQAYVVGELPTLAVPNTLLNPSDRDYGKTFAVTAVDVSATLPSPTPEDPSPEDFYAIHGRAGEVMTFEVVSNNNTLNPAPFRPELLVTDASGNPLSYAGNTNAPAPFFSGAYSLHNFESNDPVLYDVMIPAGGTYYVGVDAFRGLSAGDYNLFMYSFSTTTGTPAGPGDTIVGGGGQDTIVTSSANDRVSFLAGSQGAATVVGGSGQDVVDKQGAGAETVVPMGNTANITVINGSVATTTGLTISAASSVPNQPVTFNATVATNGGGTPAGSVTFADGGVPLATVPLDANGHASFTTTTLTTGSHSITAGYADNATFLGSTSPAQSQTVGGYGTAAHLVFLAPPDPVAGQSVNGSTGVRVAVEDQYGNIVRSDTSTVTLTVASGPTAAGFTSTSTTMVSASGGIATFSNLFLDTAGSYTLKAADGEVSGTFPSGSFTVTPAAAYQLALSVPTSSPAAGQPVTVTVAVQDQFSNVVTTDASQVTLTISSASLGSQSVTASAVSGVATFNFVLDGSGGYTFQATDGNLTSRTSGALTVSPAPATRVVFAPIAGTSAGTPLGVQVMVEDQYGNVVTTDSSSVSVAVASPTGAGFASGTTTESAVNGVATFSDLKIDTAGSYTLSASDPGLSGATSGAFAVTPAAASQLVYLTQPVNGTAGQAVAVKLAVEDAYGNIVSGDASTVSLQLKQGATSRGTVATEQAVNGIATLGPVITAAGTYTLLPADGGLAVAASNAFTIAAASASQLAFTRQPPATATAGAALSPVLVSVEDRFGNVVATDASTVAIAVATGPGGFTSGSTLTATASQGVATFSNLVLDTAGGYTLGATDGLLAAATSNGVTITPAAASQHLVFTRQPGATATAGVALSPAVQVSVEDSFGNVVTTSRATVTISTSGPVGAGFTSTSTTMVSAVNGVATFGNLVLDTAGSYTLSESATGGLSGPASTGFTVSAAAPHSLAFSVQPSNTTAGVAINSTVTVKVLDQYGNVVASDNTDQVTLGVNSGPGSFTATSTLTAPVSGGVATFGNLVLNTAGTYTLSESATGGLSGPASAGFTVAPAAATRLAFQQQPTSAAAGAVISPAVTVQLFDQFGNLATNNNTSVTIALGANPGGGTLSGTLTQPVVNGTATFNNLSINKARPGYTLVVSDGSLGATSGTFNITAAVPSQLIFTAAPVGTIAGHVLNHPGGVQVSVEDQFGNVITGNTDQVRITIASGPTNGTFSSGSVTTVAAVSGVATFTQIGLSLSGTYTLKPSDGSLTAATASVTISPNAGLLLLDPSGQGALTVSGNGHLTLTNYGAVVVNSTNAADVVVSGNGSVSASEFDVSGNPGVSGTVQGVVNKGAATADPLAGLPVPAVPSAPTGNTATVLNPGLYAGGISVSGNSSVTLNPGIYYLQRGLSVSGNSSLTGNGVMIYLTPGQGFTLSGNSTVTLTPPTSSTYQGVVVYEDRTSTAPINLSGNSALNTNGTFYAAKAQLNINGNDDLQGTHGSLGSQFIVADMLVSGNGVFSISANAHNRQQDPNAFRVAGAAPAGPAPAALTAAEVGPVVQRAIADWAAAGLDPTTVRALRDVKVVLQPLSADYLGLAAPGTVFLDPTAAGRGWFVDPTGTAAVPDGRADLLTVVAHELGHEFGLEDGDGTPLMAPTLAPGVRILPAAADLEASHTTLTPRQPMTAPDGPATSARLADSDGSTTPLSAGAAPPAALDQGAAAENVSSAVAQEDSPERQGSVSPAASSETNATAPLDQSFPFGVVVLSPSTTPGGGGAAGPARESKGRDLLFVGFRIGPRRDDLGDDGLWGLGGAVSAADGDAFFNVAGGDTPPPPEE